MTKNNTYKGMKVYDSVEQKNMTESPMGCLFKDCHYL